jgi:hypothetical protein
MKVNILSYEPAGGWVLYDYAARLVEHLKQHVDAVELSFEQRSGFDVTFHVNYAKLREIKVHGLHSTMITHIDLPRKFELVKAQAEGGVWGFCMSEETTRRLATLTGHAMFANFAPPAMMPAPRKKLTVMVSGRVYPDGRKNEAWARDFFKAFAPAELRVLAMGARWSTVLDELLPLGYEVEYAEDFERDLYTRWLQQSDHLLYTGNDEGALSTLDAILHGVVPIVTAQGYHLEQEGELISFATHGQLMAIARRLQQELVTTNAMRERLTDWDAFARRHAEHWRAQLAGLAAARLQDMKAAA